MDEGRLIVDVPRDGTLNMSVDEWLLLSVAKSQRATIRFYFWETATVSLGYFQRLADRQLHEPSAALPAVRRATGGGAIVHDQELTYSLVVPISDRLQDRHQERYLDVHRAVIKQLSQFGVKAELSPGAQARQDDPFLCFERRASGDVVVSGSKVVGSAQRRHATCLLQHGSVLLQASPSAPSLPGILDLAASPVNRPELVEALMDAICEASELDLQLQPLSQTELSEAKVIGEQKFATATWTNRR